MAMLGAGIRDELGVVRGRQTGVAVKLPVAAARHLGERIEERRQHAAAKEAQAQDEAAEAGALEQVHAAALAEAKRRSDEAKYVERRLTAERNRRLRAGCGFMDAAEKVRRCRGPLPFSALMRRT